MRSIMSSSDKSSVCMCGKGQHGTSHKSRSWELMKGFILILERLELGVVVGSWVGRLKNM